MIPIGSPWDPFIELEDCIVFQVQDFSSPDQCVAAAAKLQASGAQGVDGTWWNKSSKPIMLFCIFCLIVIFQLVPAAVCIHTITDFPDYLFAVQLVVHSLIIY